MYKVIDKTVCGKPVRFFVKGEEVALWGTSVARLIGRSQHYFSKGRAETNQAIKRHTRLLRPLEVDMPLGNRGVRVIPISNLEKVFKLTQWPTRDALDQVKFYAQAFASLAEQPEPAPVKVAPEPVITRQEIREQAALARAMQEYKGLALALEKRLAAAEARIDQHARHIARLEDAAGRHEDELEMHVKALDTHGEQVGALSKQIQGVKVTVDALSRDAFAQSEQLFQIKDTLTEQNTILHANALELDEHGEDIGRLIVTTSSQASRVEAMEDILTAPEPQKPKTFLARLGIA